MNGTIKQSTSINNHSVVIISPRWPHASKTITRRIISRQFNCPKIYDRKEPYLRHSCKENLPGFTRGNVELSRVGENKEKKKRKHDDNSENEERT